MKKKKKYYQVGYQCEHRGVFMRAELFEDEFQAGAFVRRLKERSPVFFKERNFVMKEIYE